MIWEKILEMLENGWLSLLDYISFHVLLCLIPAFFIAGAMTVFIPKRAILKYIGKDSKKIIAYPAAAIVGLLIAVCSCTVLPIFAGIKKKGAGLGPAITFLFAAPAVNILALVYTGGMIGADIAIARAVLALFFSILIGYLMELLFERKKGEIKEDIKDEDQSNEKRKKEKKLDWKGIINFTLGILGILAGILLLILDKNLLSSIGVNKPFIFQSIIWITGLGILVIFSFSSTNKELSLFLFLIYSLFTGTSQITFFSSYYGLGKTTLSPSFLNMIMKGALTLIVATFIIFHTFKNFEKEERNEWMKETWSFFKSIFPLIVIGVFLAGMLEVIIPEKWVQTVVGRNSLLGNFTGVMFGVFMYFPTLMEVPIAKMFLNLGMSRGVLLAYLLADPELSIQSILVTRKYLGDKKNLVYVILVIIFCTIAGLIFGIVVSKEPIYWY
ncbi:MAG: permease [Candidatus Heimdallarchaeum endolithica]|uniref:Permease n=1 Tax=Candidatus Heimdallarchaeum endolithica TaxID=2876572 RepID=A0A9Y1FPB0_9ARCH|nr:MAG: permease [Candidatus Heimdallarchaeum endolithica]